MILIINLGTASDKNVCRYEKESSALHARSVLEKAHKLFQGDERMFSCVKEIVTLHNIEHAQ